MVVLYWLLLSIVITICFVIVDVLSDLSPFVFVLFWGCYWLLSLTMKRKFISSDNNDKKWQYWLQWLFGRSGSPQESQPIIQTLDCTRFLKSNSRTYLDSCNFLWIGTSHHHNDSSNINNNNNDIMIIMTYNKNNAVIIIIIIIIMIMVVFACLCRSCLDPVQ